MTEDGSSEIGAEVKAARLAKKVEREEPPADPASLAKKMQSLFVEQAEKLNSIHDYLQLARDESERQRGELARAVATIQKLRDEVLTSRQVIEEVKTLARDGLVLERQRLAKERDQEHQKWLKGEVDQTHAVDRIARAMETTVARLEKLDAYLAGKGVPSFVDTAAAEASELRAASLRAGENVDVLSLPYSSSKDSKGGG